MKKHITKMLTLLSFVFVLSVVQTNAQNVESVRIAIPFDFQVGSKMLPAGNYRVSRLQTVVPNFRSLMLTEVDGNGSVVLRASTVDYGAESEESGMVFLRYGSEYFLSAITFGDKKIMLHKPSSGDILSAHNRNMKPEVVTVVFYR